MIIFVDSWYTNVGMVGILQFLYKCAVYTLYLSRYFILVEIICGNQSETKG